MAWSQNDIDALKAAMAKGVRSVRYASGQVDYMSLDEMATLLAAMEREVNPTANPTRRVGRYDNGFGGDAGYIGGGFGGFGRR